MPPPVILDPTSLDGSKVLYDKDQIRAQNPQRYEFDLLDAIIHYDRDQRTFAGYHDVRADGWWVRGHIPGRPLFPGVLMIEVAAQLASFFTHLVLQDDRFIGFAGVDGGKFRGTVEPPCRFIVAGRARAIKTRRTIFDTQGFVSGTMVFEAVITGMAV